MVVATILAGIALASGTAGALEVRSANFAEASIAPGEELRIRFDRLVGPADGALAFVDDATDLTAFFRQVTPGEFVYSGRELPLVPGQRQLKVFLVKDGQWTELRSITLKVKTESGFEQFALKPQLDLTLKGQLDQGRSGSAPAFTRRDQYQDGQLKGGLGLDLAQGDFKLSSNVNVTGTTFQPEALRFATKGNRAPQLDITDYVVNAQMGRSQYSLGHISYGNNPLLMMGYGSRGMAFRHRLGERADFSFNAMNGTSITGADNLLGLNNPEHQVRSGAVGLELLERKGALRVEAQYLDASLQSQVPFNSGAIPDAEKIRGGGLRVQGTNESGRLRGDFVFARATHTAANDPVLEQGRTLTVIAPVTKNARSLDLAYDVFKPAAGATDRFPFVLTATLRHERIDPLFKGVGVGFVSDQLLNRAGLAAQLGPLQGQWQLSRREDNLDNIPSLLKTRTIVEGVTLNLPLAQVWPGENGVPRWWMPSLGYRHENSRQFAINVPVASLSSLTGTNLPNQVNQVDSMSANWQAERWQLGYKLDLTKQDNRQTGREFADFYNVGHTLQGGYRFTPTLNVTGGFGRTAKYANENNLFSYGYNYSGGFDWQFQERWILNGTYTLNSTRDSQNLADSRGWAMQTQIAWRFTLPSFNGGRALPGQLFLRHALNDNVNRDNLAGLMNVGRFWMIQSGITVSLF